MGFKKNVGKLWAKYKALPTRKKIIYTTVFIVLHAIGIVLAVFSNKLQHNLEPLAQKMESIPEAWLILSALIAIVSIPPLFGHEILAVIAGYVYGAGPGFLILTISSIVGESFVYVAFRYWFPGPLERFRLKHAKNYGVFVAVVEDGGVVMLWLIRMSVIPPHFSTPLFSSLKTITWFKWMIANILASPVKFFPPVFIGTLLRSKNNNSPIGDAVFVVSTLVTVGVLYYIRKAYKTKKAEEKERMLAEALAVGAQDKEAKAGELASPIEAPGYVSELSTGVEMLPVHGEVRHDGNGRPLSAWPSAGSANDPEHMSEPSKAHFEEGRNWV